MSTDIPKSLIFEPIFGGSWSLLPVVLKLHYGHRAYSSDRVVVEGSLDIESKGVINVLRPFYRSLGNVPVVTESNVPVQVAFESSPDSADFSFIREFNFNLHKPYRFKSRMVCAQHGNEVIEIMRFGVCWRSRFVISGKRLEMHHLGYGIRLFGKVMPLPITWLLGVAYGEEEAVDDQRFAMKVSITHPVFGEIYSYKGLFKVSATC